VLWGFAGRGAVNMWAVALFAQAGRAEKDPFRQPEVIWGTAGLALALLVGALVIWLVDRWRKQTTVTTNSAEELTDFRGMLDRGEITEEEYAKLRTRVSGRMKQAPPAPAAPTGPAANPPAAPPAETPPQNPPPPA
jgi:hypothetical protein